MPRRTAKSFNCAPYQYPCSNSPGLIVGESRAPAGGSASARPARPIVRRAIAKGVLNAGEVVSQQDRVPERGVVVAERAEEYAAAAIGLDPGHRKVLVFSALLVEGPRGRAGLDRVDGEQHMQAVAKRGFLELERLVIDRERLSAER